MAFGDRLQWAREACGLTQKALAERLGIHPVTVSRWEAGATAIPSGRLRVVADAVGVTPDYLTGRTDHPQESVEGAPSGPLAWRAVPRGLVEVMLSVEDRVTFDEFKLLAEVFDPALGPSALRTYEWSAGQWFDVLRQMRASQHPRALRGRSDSQDSRRAEAGSGPHAFPPWLNVDAIERRSGG